MWNDVRTATADARNQGHPLLNYIVDWYCAGGTIPSATPDPIWVALEDMAQGLSYAEALDQRGIDLSVVRQTVELYIEALDGFRRKYRSLAAPELNSRFWAECDFASPSTKKPSVEEELLRQFGGHWHQFYTYTRTYAFLFEDWCYGMQMNPYNVTVERIDAQIEVPLCRNPLYWPAWRFSDGWRDEFAVVGLAANQEVQCALITHFSDLDRIHESRLGLLILNPLTADVSAFTPAHSREEWIKGLQAVHSKGNRRAPRSATDQEPCSRCVFQFPQWIHYERMESPRQQYCYRVEALDSDDVSVFRLSDFDDWAAVDWEEEIRLAEVEWKVPQPFLDAGVRAGKRSGALSDSESLWILSTETVNFDELLEENVVDLREGEIHSND